MYCQCPQCKRHLQTPPGHRRFQCPCGKKIEIVPPAPPKLVKCPKCELTLSPPKGVDVFCCPCGETLSMPRVAGQWHCKLVSPLVPLTSRERKLRFWIHWHIFNVKSIEQNHEISSNLPTKFDITPFCPQCKHQNFVRANCEMCGATPSGHLKDSGRLFPSYTCTNLMTDKSTTIWPINQ